MLLVWCERTKRQLPFEEKVMADFTKLMADLADLSAKVDAADQAVGAIIAKIPS